MAATNPTPLAMLLLLAAAGVASAQPPSPDGSFVADDVGSTPFGDCRPVAAWSRSGNKYTKICGMYGVELCGAPTAVSGIEYTPRCEWVATEPTTAAPASTGVAASKCALTRCADGYTCVEGKGCVKDAPRICCKAVNAQCLSCSAGVSVIDYCRKNPRTAGCPIIEPMGCAQYPKWQSPLAIASCKGQTCKVAGTTAEKMQCPQVKCAKPECENPKFDAPVFKFGSDGVCCRTNHCAHTCLETKTTTKPATTINCATRDVWDNWDGKKRSYCCNDKTFLGQHKEKFCCKWGLAKCDTSTTTAKPGMCALIRCEAGTVCIEGKGCVKKPEPPVCCKAMTAQCLSCAAGVSVDEYCKENPHTAGCKTITTPPRPCPVMGMLVCPNNVAPVCGEPTVLFPGCTLPSCKCPVSPCEAASRANLAALENTALAVHAQMQAMVADLKHVGVETAHLEAQSAALKRAIAAKGC